MTQVLIAFMNNAASLVAVVGAIILAYNGIKGWGWFLFVGLLAVTYNEYQRK